MSIFDQLAKYIMDVFKLKKKSDKRLTPDKIEYICKLQSETLADLYNSIDSFLPSDLNNCYKKYLATPNDLKQFLPQLTNQYKSKASMLEKQQCFGAIKKVASILIKLNEEVLKNLETFVKDEGIYLYESKISTVMFFGLLRQTDLFINYSCYLWNHFTGVVAKTRLETIGYQKKFLMDHQKQFVAIVNAICEKDNGYSFITTFNDLKRKNADLLLYSDGTYFSSVLNKSLYTGEHERLLENGIIGFNIVSDILEVWDLFTHYRYLKNKEWKEKLENDVALMRYDLMNVPKDDPEYSKLAKRIELYDAEIAKIDRKLKEYEEG